MKISKTASPICFDNGSSNSERSLNAWRDWFHPVLDISAEEDEARRFYSTNKVWDIGGILFTRSVASATRVTRGKLNISRAPIDHWVISYNRRGTTSIVNDKNLLKVPPEVPFLWSLGDKTSSQRSDVDRIQLMVPRDMFRDVAPMFDARRGSTLDTPLGTLLGDYMLFLESRLDTVAASDLPRLAGAIRSMIAACIAPSGERAEIATAQIEHGRRERVCRMIHLSLRSRSLSPEMICKHAGISRSQLYRLFQSSGGVLHYIQRERLVRCHAILSDPENRKSILSVAESFGFTDPSSFRRAFRREFGLSPKDVKFASQAGMGMPADIGERGRRGATPQRFYDLIAAR